MNDAVAEPSDVGPMVGGGVRASDRDRELVTEVLNTAFTDGRLTRDELDERIEQAMSARTFDDLTPLTRDLVPTTAYQQVSTRTSGPVVAEQSTEVPPENIVAIFGGADRKGPVRVNKTTNCFAMFGGVDIDWTEATFSAQEVEVRAGAIFGGVDIKLPDGVAVRNETAGIFGGTEVSRTAPLAPGTPVVVIKGVCLFGGITARGPKIKKGKKKP